MQVWCKPLGTDFTNKAVALFNNTTTAQSITVTWTNLGLQAGAATVRDLWAHANLGTFLNSFTTNVPSHGTVLLKVTGLAPNIPASGTNYLSDLRPVYAYTSWGTLLGNESIAGDPLTLNGKTYAKGLGANAYAGFEYRLGGVASRFQSDIGVDDDAGTAGSVVFQVYADGVKIYESPVMTGGAPHQSINLDVTGVNRLTLGANDADDGNANDHADWAGALVIVSNALPVAPSAPTGLDAVDGLPVILAWNATPGAMTYNVKRASSGSGPFTNLATTPFLQYADSNATVGATYYYEIAAVGKFGVSSNSAVVSAEACSPPPAPTTMVVNVTSSHATLTWNAVSGATGYIVERSVSATPFGPIGFSAGPNFTDTNLVGGTGYLYQVIPTNACSQGAASAYVFATLRPPTPTGLSATPADGSIALDWNAATGASAYNVKRATAANGPYFTVGTNVANTVYLDAGLTAGTTFYYEVSSLNTGGESSNSFYASATACGGALPAGWTSLDIGSVGIAGSASSCDGNSFVVQGSGADIWGSADAFNFASEAFNGNSSVAARVVAVEPIDPWTKTGLMFRNDTTAGSAFVDLFATPGNGVNMQWRSASGGQCSSSSSANITWPVWLNSCAAGLRSMAIIRPTARSGLPSVTPASPSPASSAAWRSPPTTIPIWPPPFSTMSAPTWPMRPAD